MCDGSTDTWYERTAYRKIPHSTCEGGLTHDLGEAHTCPGLRAHGFWFWALMGLIAVALTALFSLWWRRSPYARGFVFNQFASCTHAHGYLSTIRLPERGDPERFDDSGPLATLASIPWYVLGVAGTMWSKISPRLPFIKKKPGRGGYRTVAVDEDAQVLRFEDD